jgi:two-component system chemotaxis sensor kinase CheA
MDDLLMDFLTETQESLAALDVALVRLERNPTDEETLGLIFRLVHTIKGTCGFLGLPRLERVAHAAENVLGRVRDRQLVVTAEIITTVLSALDAIKRIVAALGAAGREPAGDDAGIIAALDAIFEGRAAPLEPPHAAAAPPVAAPPVAAGPPPVAVSAPMAPPVDLAPARAEPVAVEPAPVDPPPMDQTSGPQTIRVGVDVLEDLMTLVSELVLTRNQLLQLARAQENTGFSVPLQRLSHITSDLQEGVMKTRMQPIGNAWNKLPRLVRDLARDVGKKIELVMHGAETELDRQVLELIKDPLTHMVRNSGDHGLETAAERREAGKPETGRITLNAFHEGGHIIIEIADDGRGLPIERIRAKALARGLATEAELATMSEALIQRFIFRPGFSTAAAITAVSGRGVGMDVVKTNIERIGGTIDLRSVAGQGTTFIIKIPLTLAIVSALIVEASGERFAIPQLSVVELVRANLRATPAGANPAGGDAAAQGGDNAIEHLSGTPVLRLRDRLLPLVSLADLLALGGTTQAQDSTIVVAQVGAQMLGIIVDRVFDTEEIVVKPVAPILRHMTMFSGNTILGDGSVIMILDPNGIARATGIAAGSEDRAGGRARGRDGQEQDEAVTSDAQAERSAMLLFRANGGKPMAVPLGLVSRLEHIARDDIEWSGGRAMTQYRGRLMPLVPLSGQIAADRASHPVLVFSDSERGGEHERRMGLVVDEIVDVVEDHLAVQLGSASDGLLGTAVIAGHATDVIDTGFWLTQAFTDWFRPARGVSTGRKRLLVVEDSGFFRQMLVPSLTAAGYAVTAVPDAARALKLRDQGIGFDAIISDIEMPGMDGLAFVGAVREGGAWTELPVIALTSHAAPDAVEAGRAAGFTDYVEKFEREALLASLRHCLVHGLVAARPTALAA